MDQNSETGSNIDLSSLATCTHDIVGNTRPFEPPKDANEALLTGWDLNELLEEASELPHERILKFSDVRDQVSCVCEKEIGYYMYVLFECLLMFLTTHLLSFWYDY